MKKLLFCTSILALSYSLSYAQAYKLHQVIVLNDGNILESGGQHTRVGSYNPVTKVYQDFDTIAAEFGSHVIIDSGYIYVGADSLLIKYDLNTHAKLATQTVIGIREMAVWGNQILVTTGTTYPLKSYFQSYNKSTLAMVYQDTTISYSTEGIQVLNDSAYIAINGFGTAGYLGVEDLKGQKEKHEVNLGANGLNPYSVFVEPSIQKIYTVNDLNYAGSSVTKYDAPTSAFSNNSLHISSGCTSSAYYQGNVYFQPGYPSYAENILLFNTTTLTVWDSLKINKTIYGMGIDSADGYIYVSQTDYQTYGNVFIYNLFGAPIDSFATDIGPGNFAFDIRAVTSVPEVTVSNLQLTIYPNPTSNEIHVNYTGAYKGVASLVMTDVLGREVFESEVNTSYPTTLSLNSFSSGVYFLTLETANGKTVQKIVKE